MIKLKQAVVVEGKYDKIALDNIIDAVIIKTDGFGIFKDKQKQEYIRKLARTNGIIVMTDSDSAGAVIRSELKSICNEGEIINVYIPKLSGKEKRKEKPSKEKLLGVEGMSEEIILNALKKSGIGEIVNTADKRKVEKLDLFLLGLSGGNDSARLRKELSGFLELPDNLSPNAFLDAVNAVYGYEEFVKQVEKWRRG